MNNKYKYMLSLIFVLSSTLAVAGSLHIEWTYDPAETLTGFALYDETLTIVAEFADDIREGDFDYNLTACTVFFMVATFSDGPNSPTSNVYNVCPNDSEVVRVFSGSFRGTIK